MFLEKCHGKAAAERYGSAGQVGKRACRLVGKELAPGLQGVCGV